MTAGEALEAVAAAIAGVLEAEHLPVLAPARRAVARLGLALEPWPELAAWCAREELDAVLLHRPWGARLPPQVGLLGAHEPLDRAIVPWLSAVAGVRQGRWPAPKLLVGDAPPGVRDRVRAALDGEEGFHAGAQAPEAAVRVGFAAAMTGDLVRRAAAEGARLYVTGQWRVPAASAVAETGIAVQVTGHARTEQWVLRTLARHLRRALPGVTPVVRSSA